jgi:hypothetical protein
MGVGAFGAALIALNPPAMLREQAAKWKAPTATLAGALAVLYILYGRAPTSWRPVLLGLFCGGVFAYAMTRKGDVSLKQAGELTEGVIDVDAPAQRALPPRRLPAAMMG